MPGLIIDDATSNDVLFPPDKGRGLDVDAAREGIYYGVAEPFPRELVIPRSEWQARAEEIERRQMSLWHQRKRANISVKDQGQSNYCWINSPAYCVELLRMIQNQKHVELSPASGGCQIKGYRNVGGWGREALQWIEQHGLYPVSLWPANAIRQGYKTTAGDAEARKFVCQEWWSLGRDWDAVVSCMLRLWPVSGGFNWWGHQVTLVRPLWRDGDIDAGIDNSWGRGWGEDGYGELSGARKIPDDAVVPRALVA